MPNPKKIRENSQQMSRAVIYTSEKDMNETFYQWAETL